MATRGRNSTRSPATPRLSNSARTSDFRRSDFTSPISSREPGTRISICAQRRHMAFDTLVVALNDPNVTWPLRSNGGTSATATSCNGW